MSSKKKKSPATDKSPPAKQLTLDTVLKVLGALVGVASLTFGIYQYRTRFQSDERRQQQERIASQYKLKQDLYAKAMKSATDFAGASTAAEADTAKKDFWGLYWGQLSTVENAGVKAAMQTFGGAIKTWDEKNDPSDFTPPSDIEFFPDGADKPSVRINELAYRLTLACRKDLETR